MNLINPCNGDDWKIKKLGKPINFLCQPSNNKMVLRSNISYKNRPEVKLMERLAIEEIKDKV